MASENKARRGPLFRDLIAAGAELIRPPVNVSELASLGGQAIEMAEDRTVPSARREAAQEIAFAACGLLARLAMLGLEARDVRRP